MRKRLVKKLYRQHVKGTQDQIDRLKSLEIIFRAVSQAQPSLASMAMGVAAMGNALTSTRIAISQAYKRKHEKTS